MTLTLDSPLLRSEIIGYMVFPSDEQQRTWWRLSTIAETIARESLEVTLSAQELRTLKDGPEFDAMGDLVRKASRGGIIAGETLIRLLRLEESGIPPSLGKAQYLLENAIKQTPRGDDGKPPLPGSINSIRNSWLSFKSVSHLWAARQLTHERAVEHAIAECDLDKNPRNFLGLAASLHRLTSALTSNDGNPLFGTDTWEVPSDISAVDVSLFELTDHEKSYLRRYTPRARD